MLKKCTPLWREAHLQVKMDKTHQHRTTFGSSDVEKVHAIVARSTFPSQNVQNTRGADHFWKLRCRKSARRCGAKHISKWKVLKTDGLGPLFDVQMSKKCTLLWREAHFQVKMYKTHHSRITFGSWDVEFRKSARRCGAKQISKSKCPKHTMFGPLLEAEMSSCEKVHAVVARSTVPSQNVQNTPCSDHFLAVQMLLRLTRLHYIRLHFAALHYITLHYITLHFTTLQVTTTTTQLQSTTLHYTKLHCTTLSTLHFTTLHDTTLHYTTNTITPTQLHSTTLHYTTALPYTTLRSTTLQLKLHNYTPLHYTTLHYTTLHYTRPHYTTLHYTTLPSTTLHDTTLHVLHSTTLHLQLQLHSTTLHYITLHYATLHHTEWHCAKDRQVDR